MGDGGDESCGDGQGMGTNIFSPCNSLICTIQLFGHLFIAVACIICRSDADPDVLAKYVIALVKKDKPVAELIATCQDQLDIFLQESMHF